MHIFIDFWKLETENSILHIFSFLHKLNFENSFCFLPILSCQRSFLVLKIENCFWKQKIRGKNSYQTYPKFWSWFVNTLDIEVLIHLVPKVLEPNRHYCSNPRAKQIIIRCNSRTQNIYRIFINGKKGTLVTDKVGSVWVEVSFFATTKFISLVVYICICTLWSKQWKEENWL